MSELSNFAETGESSLFGGLNTYCSSCYIIVIYCYYFCHDFPLFRLGLWLFLIPLSKCLRSHKIHNNFMSLKRQQMPKVLPIQYFSDSRLNIYSRLANLDSLFAGLPGSLNQRSIFTVLSIRPA